MSNIALLLGTMVSSGAKDGHVRSFAADLDTLRRTEQRCNIRYDVLLAFNPRKTSWGPRGPIRDLFVRQFLGVRCIRPVYFCNLSSRATAFNAQLKP